MKSNNTTETITNKAKSQHDLVIDYRDEMSSSSGSITPMMNFLSVISNKLCLSYVIYQK